MQYKAKVMKNETFYVSGRVSTHDTRTVKVQYKSGDSWKTTATGTSNSGGYFGFSGIHTSKTRYFRYYAPSSGGDSSIKGNAEKVTVVKQKAKFFGITPDFQCTNVGHGNVTMFAQFYPARPGRYVTFHTNAGDPQDQQDGHGNATITFAPGTSTFDYVSVAEAVDYHGATFAESDQVDYGQSPCLL